MLKREITYEDFEGNPVTDVYYFNMTRIEWLEFNAEFDGGMEGVFKRIIETKDLNGVVSTLKKIILAAYGVKSDDGKRFIKNPQVREEFTQTPAFDVLFMDVATNDNAALNFIQGIMPKEFRAEFDKAITAQDVVNISVVGDKV